MNRGLARNESIRARKSTETKGTVIMRKTMNGSTFEQEVLQGSGPVLVDF